MRLIACAKFILNESFIFITLTIKGGNTMIEYVHKHITTELDQNTRTDTIFILTSIVLNLITLAVNSGMSKESRTNTSTYAVMFVFVALIIIVNLVVVIG